MKPALVALRIRFDLGRLAAALLLDEATVQAAFRDGRGAWPFSERWGERLFEFVAHANTNMPVSDGRHAFPRLGDLSVSVKALTGAGIKFQQSKFVGFGRKGDKANLIASLEGCDRVVAVDITAFPDVVFFPVDSRRLLTAAHGDRLTMNGWSRAAFMAWVAETYDLTFQDLDLAGTAGQ